MAETIAVLTPRAAELPAADYPQLLITQRRPVLAFDASTDEACQWTLKAKQSLGSTLTLVVQYIMATAASGTIDFEASVEAISDGDAVAMDAADSFDTPNTMTAKAVPATQGYIDEFTITLTNKDSIAAGDYVRIKLMRDADDATNDTAVGDCWILGVELRDA